MYAPLKVTTDYSLLKSLIKIDDLINFLVKNNITSCAICDENLYGAIEFYNKCKTNNIKPIIGLEVILNNLPIYLYAKNYNGYKNLLKIHTIIQKRELAIIDLEKYKKDIVVILPYKSNELYNNILFFKDIYVGYENAFEKNNAKILNDNTIYVNDIKALFVEDLKYLEYLDKLRKDVLKDYSYNYYLNSTIIDEFEIDEFVSLFDIEMPIGNKYIPTYNKDIDSYKFLYTLSHKGLEKRLNGNVSDKYIKRLTYELNVINNMGFVDYFLIVYDYVLFAKKNNILVGPGRGSAAGSLVSYSIGITDIDPLKYNLLFERFLNPERITMPDIDIDFDANKRDLVITYVKNNYGEECVAPGLTFNTLKSKLVLREVCKLLNVEQGLVDKFVKEINAFLSLKDNLKNERVKKYLNNYKVLSETYKIALKLENLKKNISTHAAGIVISSTPLDEVIPICIHDNTMNTGLTMEFLEDIGLLKMDFLGLKNLTTIANILEVIGKEKIENLDLEDPKVYSLFSSGKTDGIFQFETPAMKNLLMKLKPNCFNDLIAAVALGRPGPKDHQESFFKRKNNEEKSTYLHPDLTDILKDTYGILLYQEQIIAILGKVGGYSYGEADIIRRAISKKKEDIILSEKKKFIKRAKENGYEESFASEIYDQISKFASYGFNKSHSVAYSLIAYQMAYLKTYYPAHFIVELLNNGSSKNSIYFAYLKQKGIKFYKPSVNNRKTNYEIINNKLVMPLSTINNINNDLAKKILEAKEEKYEDFFDFILKTKDIINKKMLEVLIHAGALDCFQLNHQTLIENIDNAINYASLGDLSFIKKPAIVEYPEYSEDILRSKEIESYGFYITNHPSSRYNTTKIMNLNKYLFKKIELVVIIDNIKRIKTKKNEDMAFLNGNDETGGVDFTIFNNNIDSIKDININDLVKINGQVTKRFDKVQVVINGIKKIENNGR